jgi:hypothetical protein
VSGRVTAGVAAGPARRAEATSGHASGASGAWADGPGDGSLEVLRKALAAEHAAVYAYGVVAARTRGDLRARLASAFDAHRARRDRLRGLIIARGGTPAEPEASYLLPVTPTTAEAAVDLAVLVEDRVTAAYLELVAVPEPALRGMAALAMQESVARSYGLRPAISAFPGMPPVVTSAQAPTSVGTPPVEPPVQPSASSPAPSAATPGG